MLFFLSFFFFVYFCMLYLPLKVPIVLKIGRIQFHRDRRLNLSFWWTSMTGGFLIRLLLDTNHDGTVHYSYYSYIFHESVAVAVSVSASVPPYIVITITIEKFSLRLYLSFYSLPFSTIQVNIYMYICRLVEGEIHALDLGVLCLITDPITIF